jgi:hypothetical protein
VIKAVFCSSVAFGPSDPQDEYRQLFTFVNPRGCFLALII